jgi:hypothetical protein
MIPVKPRSAQVIDLTDDSDGDEEEDSEDDEDEEEIELLGATNVILARHTGKGPIPATRTNGQCRDLLARAEKEYLHRPLQAIDSIAGSSKRSAIDDTYVGDGPTRVSKFWKPRDGPATPQSSTASDSTMTMSDESTPSARSISITLTPTPEIVQVKYKGPILTEISTKAIWSHLDNGWKHVKRNKTALRSLATWWAWTPVNKAHKLGTQENWLLAYATFKWWEALEERWRTVLSETGPGSYVQVGMTMKEIRLKKEGREVTAAMQCEGIRKDVNAVYKLYGALEDVKKVSVEDGDVKGNITQSGPLPPKLGEILGAISDLSAEDIARRYEAKYDNSSKPALKGKIGSH